MFDPVIVFHCFLCPKLSFVSFVVKLFFVLLEVIWKTAQLTIQILKQNLIL